MRQPSSYGAKKTRTVMVVDLILVAVGGALGAVARRVLTMVFENGPLAQFATLPVNIAGCFLAGLLIALVPAGAHPGWKLFLGGGFLGGFTTFSAFSLEVSSLVGDMPVMGMFYALATTLLCVASVMAGLWFGRLVSL